MPQEDLQDGQPVFMRGHQQVDGRPPSRGSRPEQNAQAVGFVTLYCDTDQVISVHVSSCPESEFQRYWIMIFDTEISEVIK
jgi:hypothetical protein